MSGQDLNSHAHNGVWLPDRSALEIRHRVHYPSTRETINDACSLILGVAEECGCTAEQQADLEIALREALANAVIHGNDENEDKNVFVRCYGGDMMTLVAIRDEGPGFIPAEVPDPRNSERLQLDHGRGLFLMRALMDRVEYRRDGREVVLFKRW